MSEPASKQIWTCCPRSSLHSPIRPKATIEEIEKLSDYLWESKWWIFNQMNSSVSPPRMAREREWFFNSCEKQFRQEFIENSLSVFFFCLHNWWKSNTGSFNNWQWVCLNLMRRLSARPRRDKFVLEVWEIGKLWIVPSETLVFLWIGKEALAHTSIHFNWKIKFYFLSAPISSFGLSSSKVLGIWELPDAN